MIYAPIETKEQIDILEHDRPYPALSENGTSWAGSTARGSESVPDGQVSSSMNSEIRWVMTFRTSIDLSGSFAY